MGKKKKVGIIVGVVFLIYVGIAINSTYFSSFSDFRTNTPSPSVPSISAKTFEIEIPEGSSDRGCEISSTCYMPSSKSIKAGDTIRWVNLDGSPHTVTSGSLENGPDGNFDTGLIKPGKQSSVKFPHATTYDYFCIVHPWAKGTIIVS